MWFSKKKGFIEKSGTDTRTITSISMKKDITPIDWKKNASKSAKHGVSGFKGRFR